MRACNDSAGGDRTHTNSTTGGTVVTFTNSINQMGGGDGGMVPYYQQLQPHSLLQSQPSGSLQSNGSRPGRSSLPASTSQYTGSLSMGPPSYNSVMKSRGIAGGHHSLTELPGALEMSK